MEVGVIVDPNTVIKNKNMPVTDALHEKVPCAFETYLSDISSMKKNLTQLADLRKRSRVSKNIQNCTNNKEK
ncbi:hypothetical protein L9F63_021750, partial [Diploptera punctata]